MVTGEAFPGIQGWIRQGIPQCWVDPSRDPPWPHREREWEWEWERETKQGHNFRRQPHTLLNRLLGQRRLQTDGFGQASPGNRISAEPPPVAEKLGPVGRRRGLLYNWRGNERLRSEGKRLGRFWPLDFIMWQRIFYRTAKSLARRATCAMGVFGLFETRPV